MKRMLYSLIIIYICCVPLAGCYDYREIDELTYITAIGLDKGSSQPLKVSFQYVIPKSLEGGGENGKGGLGLVSLDTDSIYSGLNQINSITGRQSDLSTIKFFVISEELAREGIGRYLNNMSYGKDVRPDVSIMVYHGDPEDYLKSIKPEQEIDPAKYYQLLSSSYQYTGLSVNSSYKEFVYKMQSPDIQPTAMYAFPVKSESDESEDEGNPGVSTNGSTKPQENEKKVTENISSYIKGFAVFKGDKMVGAVNEDEALYYLLVSGGLRHVFITIPYSETSSEKIILNMRQEKKPVRTVEFKEGNPEIFIDITLSADIVSQSDKIQIKQLEKTSQKFLERKISELLRSITDTYGIDIWGFAKEARMRFTTLEDWNRYHWPRKYSKASFNVNIDVRIRQSDHTLQSQNPAAVNLRG